MIRNMGSADRIIRFLLALFVVILYLTDQVSGTAAIILGIVAAAFFVTSFLGYCPIYHSIKIKTIKKAA